MANTKTVEIKGRTVRADLDEHEIYVYLNDDESYNDEGENALDRVNAAEEFFGDNVEFWALHDEVFGKDKESFEMESWNDYDAETYLIVRTPSPDETYAWEGSDEN